MSRHLSSLEISRIAAGERSREETQHAIECAGCAAEIDELRDTLALFRTSVRDWSERSGASVPDSALLERAAPAMGWQQVRWAVATGLLMILLILPVYEYEKIRRDQPGGEDALLLEQIDAHLSRSVPAAMEPLMELLAEDSAGELGGRQ